MRFLRGAVLVGAPLAVLVAIASPLVADGVRLEPVRDSVVAKECSACHMLYPAGLLPARSWRGMTSTLADHFGDNAALDDPTAARIAAYLAANAADAAARNRKMMRGLAADVTPARITELPWWTRKHERKDRVAPATLARKGAKFKGDCKACHDDAERGLFDDD
ncbi:MAG: cytochrome C [Rhodoplanes sp.]|uniref:hypothetical protein n=1 Tax=Rhodoplanes sp. TaxID=1968906 RepID=UPI0017AEC49B|nr:hypothetical protein [Rhodoplanes sp.]NVO13327.1 cytochrome C [Rhodoplanes sp.]